MTNKISSTRARLLGATLVIVAAALTALGGGINGMLLYHGLNPVMIIAFDTIFGGLAGLVFYSITSRKTWRQFRSCRLIVGVVTLAVCTTGFKLGFIFAQQLIPIAEVSCVYYAAQSWPALWEGMKTVWQAEKGWSVKAASAGRAFFSPVVALTGVVLFTEPWSATAGNETLIGVLLALGAGLTRVIFFRVTNKWLNGKKKNSEEAEESEDAKNDVRNRMAATLSYLLTGVGTLVAVGWPSATAVSFAPVGSMLIILALLGVGVLSTSAPNELQMRGQSLLDDEASFSVVRSMSPLFAAVVGVALLHQVLDPVQWAAVGASVLALLVKNLVGIKKADPDAPDAAARVESVR